MKSALNGNIIKLSQGRILLHLSCVILLLCGPEFCQEWRTSSRMLNAPHMLAHGIFVQPPCGLSFSTSWQTCFNFPVGVLQAEITLH